MNLAIEKLSKSHNKREFECDNYLLNNYIKKQPRQDSNRDLSVCYILNDIKSKCVIGYYTLSGNSIDRDDFPLDLNHKMPPSYLNFPTILLGRLAVDRNHKGLGYGTILLMDALKKCVDISESLGILAVVVDPYDENAIGFYEKFGFILILSNNKMFITIKTIQNLF